jgi:hypothetical protein
VLVFAKRFGRCPLRWCEERPAAWANCGRRCLRFVRKDLFKFSLRTTTLVDESDYNNGGFVNGLNDKVDAVGWWRGMGGFSSGIPALFTSGQLVDLNGLFPPGSGWVAQTSDRINDTGEIAGTGTVNGLPAAFVLTPVPSATYSAQSLCAPCTGILLSNSGFPVSRETSPISRFLVSSRPRPPFSRSTTLAPLPDPICQVRRSSPIRPTINSII